MSDRFTELKNSAYQSSQVIGAQLQGVESSLLGASLAVLISALISRAFDLLIFWIPASFLLMWLLLMISLFVFLIPLVRGLLTIVRVMSLFLGPMSTVRLLLSLPSIVMSSLQSLTTTEQNPIAQAGGLFSRASTFSTVTSLKNTAPLFKTIGVIFLASLSSLFIYRLGLIRGDITFSITVPLICSLLFMPLPMLNNLAITKLENIKSIGDLLSKVGYRGLLSIVFGSSLYVLALLAFPIWSLVVLQPIYIGVLQAALSKIVVMFFLVVTALAFMNYFSASLVRKEMSTALFHLSNIKNRIEELLSDQQQIPEEVFQELGQEYAEAKRYGIKADDTLVVNYYSIIADPTYLSGLANQQPVASNPRPHNKP